MTKIQNGRFVWFEHMSTHETKAQAFYGELFHWKTKPMPMPQGTYTMITVGDRDIGGYLRPPTGTPEQARWVSHLQVASASETASKIKSLGGKVMREPFKVGDVGTMVVVEDPFGAAFALWQPVKAEPGYEDYRGVEGAWIWNELYTPDIDKAVQFYAAIAGFAPDEMKKERGAPGPDRYVVLKSGGKGRAGVTSMEGVPAQWMPYVQVANADATIERAKKLGGSIKHPPETIPNTGRIAVFADPQGAFLGILQPQPM